MYRGGNAGLPSTLGDEKKLRNFPAIPRVPAASAEAYESNG
jgi:hypothetical protein